TVGDRYSLSLSTFSSFSFSDSLRSYSVALFFSLVDGDSFCSEPLLVGFFEASSKSSARRSSSSSRFGVPERSLSGFLFPAALLECASLRKLVRLPVTGRCCILVFQLEVFQIIVCLIS